MYPPPDPRPRRRWWPVVHSWIVVVTAPATLGMLTFAAFWYAAARMRSRVVALCAAGYTAATVLEFVWAGSENVPPAPGFDWMLATTLIVGTGHLLTIRGRLARALAADPRYDPPRPRWPADALGSPPPARALAQDALEDDPAYVEALRRHARRERARALVVDNPALAAELHVGRPDLDREFDDGGLVDVNEVPAATLATLPGFTSELAESVVRARQRVGGRFFSAEELVVHGGVPAEILERVRDRLLFRPL
jgi:Helix-hairpin-helix motif